MDKQQADPARSPEQKADPSNSIEFRKELYQWQTFGRDADLLKNNPAFQKILIDWEEFAKEAMIRAQPFDNETRIKAKITLENIDFLKRMVDSTILQGHNAGLQLAGQDVKPENVGIL